MRCRWANRPRIETLTLQDEIERIWQTDQKTVVLITNDVDEGILLADRIIPLSAGPAATLGPSLTVDIERPRDRKALNHDPRFKFVRNQVIEYLLGPAKSPRKPGLRKRRDIVPHASRVKVLVPKDNPAAAQVWEST